MHSLITHLDAMIAANTAFDEIEDEIEALPITEHQRSALWLYAWVETDRAQRQVAVRQILATA